MITRHTSCIVLLLCVVSCLSHADVIINELQYHPINDPYEEYIELFNTGSQIEDISGWKLADGIDFLFPEGTTIGPKGFLLVVKSTNTFIDTYGTPAAPVAGTYTRQLANKGERIVLLAPDGAIRDEILYDDKFPWDPDADGSGPSLERISPYITINDYHNWRASIFGEGTLRGTPGRRNSVMQESVAPFISEVSHFPPIPSENETTLVSAYIEGAPEARVVLYYHTDTAPYMTPERRYIATPMEYNGEWVWKKRILKRYAAVIPAHAPNVLVRYYVEALGQNGAKRYFPADAPQIGRGWLVSDSSLPSLLPQDALIMAPKEFQRIYNNPEDETLETIGSYIGNGELFDKVVISLRGGSARNLPKKNWKVRLPKSNTMDGERRIINLNSDVHDVTHLANYLSMAMYDRFGIPVPEMEFVRLDINGDYFGVFYRVEQYNIQWLERNGMSKNGDLYQSHHSNTVPLSPLHYPYLYEKKSGIDKSDFSSLQVMVEGLNSLPYYANAEFVESNFDMNNLFNYCVCKTLISMADDWHKNHYFYKNTPDEGSRWIIIPWDDDITWGHINRWDIGLLNTDFITTQPAFYNINTNPLLNIVCDTPRLRNEFYRRLYKAVQNDFTEEIWWKRIDDLAAAIRYDVYTDPNKWLDNQAFEDYIEQMKQYITLRRHFLLEVDIPQNYKEAGVTDWHFY